MTRWKIYKRGKTLGTIGSEKGTIVLDWEYDDSFRITLEKLEKYFAITVGIYGFFVNTIYGDEFTLRKVVEGLKIELMAFKYLPDSEHLIEKLKWCHNFYKRYPNDVPKIKSIDGYAFDIRSYSLNHFLVDMVPSIKRKFENESMKDYTYGSYLSYTDVLKPYTLKCLINNNADELKKIMNCLEEISFSEDNYIENFFVIGILEDIFFFKDKIKTNLLQYLGPNTLAKYKEYETEFKIFWYKKERSKDKEDSEIDEYQICPNCGGRTAYLDNPNHDGLIYCPKCNRIVAVSTFSEDIDLDKKDYIITISPNDISKLNHDQVITRIKIISELTGMNYINAKKTLEEGGEIFKGNARDAKKYIIRLKVAEISFKTNPKYPLNYFLRSSGW